MTGGEAWPDTAAKPSELRRGSCESLREGISPPRASIFREPGVVGSNTAGPKVKSVLASLVRSAPSAMRPAFVARLRGACLSKAEYHEGTEHLAERCGSSMYTGLSTEETDAGA